MKAFIVALLTLASFSMAHADAHATPTQIENAKKAALAVVADIAQQRESVLFAGKSGWSLTPFDPKSEDRDKAFQVAPIQMFSRQVNRISVRMWLNAVGPNGEVKWFAGGNYRILVDLKDNGEVIAAELNYFNNLMSYEDMAPATPSHE